MACLVRIEQSGSGALVFILCQLGAAIAYLLAATWVKRAKIQPSILSIVGVAILAYTLALWAPPLFDDDLWRYTWDGKLLVNGMNPFVHPPNSLDAIDLWRKDQYKIPYDHVSTIYPPATQGVFWLTSLVKVDSFLAMKLSFTLASFMCATLIWALLGALNKPRSWVLFYLWNPLVIKEIGNSGHMDAWLMVWVLACVLCFVKGWERRALLAWTVAVLCKFVPLIAVPTIFRRLSKGNRLLLPLTLLLMALSYIPFMGPGAQLFAGLSTYGQYWVFNHGFYDLLERTIQGLSGWAGDSQSLGLLARAIAAAFMAMISLLVAYRLPLSSRPELLPMGFMLSFAGVLAFAPTVDPWYLMWLAPFAALYPSRPLILASLLPILSYAYYIAEVDLPVVRFVEYSVFYGVLAHYIVTNSQRLKGIFSGE